MSADVPQKFEISERIQADTDFLWEILSNTEHLNRWVGLPPVEYSPAENDKTGLFRIARASKGPISLEWREYPFDWVKPNRYSVYREFTKGPLHWVRGGIELLPHAEKITNVRIFAEVLAKGAIGRLLARQNAQKAFKDTLRYIREAIQLKEKTYTPLPRRSNGSNSVQERIRAKLQTVISENELLKYMEELLVYGSDEEVLSIRPADAAQKTRIDVYDVVRQFLKLVKNGILSLEWKLLCPNCRVPKANADSLQQLPDSLHCDFCGINYNIELEEAIEMRFRVHPSIRSTFETTYCIGGPVNSPHAFAQISLEPGRSTEVELPPASDLRIRTLKTNIVRNFPEGSGNLRATFIGTDWNIESAPHVEGSGLLISIENKSDAPFTAVIEDRVLNRTTFTLAKALTIQDFRDSFSREILAPGLSVKVESNSILFTDLTESTMMYENTGDAKAYVSVRKHFDLLIKIIDRNNGAIVKTIGDAVMASFQGTADCLRASLEICAEAKEFARIMNRDDPAVVRVGFHTGEAILVNANERMDYFGRTVNIAARIQGVSKGADLVVSSEILDQPECREVLDDFQFESETFDARLKGIDLNWNLRRLSKVSSRKVPSAE